MKKIFTLLAAVLVAGSMMAVNLLTTVDSVTCWSQPGWGAEQYTNFITYADGSINVAVPGACNAAWQCQVKVHTSGVTLDPTKNYTFSCAMQSSAAFGGVTVKMWDNLELSLKTDVELVAGPNTYTSAAFAGRTDENNGIIVFDFGYAPAGTTITISGLTIEESTAPVVADPKPTTAPAAPTADAATVLSVYSNTYTAAATFGFCENWSQTTTLEELNLDGNNVLYYKNFNYLGWATSTPIDASTCTGLHMDIWSPAAGNLRIYPIYGGTGLATDDSKFKVVTLAEGWNSVDFDLATDFAGLDLSSIFQFKFDQGAAQQYAFDNVYFTGYTAPSVTYTSLADTYTKANKDTVVLKDFEVVYVNGGYCYIKDATASGLIFKNNYGLVAGDKVAKGMVATISIYNNLYELVPVTPKADLTITAGTPAQPVQATAAPTAADNKYVVYKNVKLLSDMGKVVTANRTVKGVFGKDTITFYNTFKLDSVAIDLTKTYDVVGFNTCYKTTIQVAVASIEEHIGAVDECAGEHGLFNAETAVINSTYLAPNWVADAGSSAEISNGVITMHVNNGFVDMWNGQVFVDPGFTFEAGKMYHYEFDLVSTGKVCIFVKVNDSDADAFYAKAFYDLNLTGGTWHFSTDSVIANENLVAGRGPLVFGFGWTDGNQDVIIKCIKITEMGDAPVPVEEKMYIKHPWGTGANADWTWKEMADTTFMNVKGWYVVDAWGGVGFNIADNAEGNDAKWFAANNIRFIDSEGIITEAPAVGTANCTFVYVPSLDNGGIIPCSYVVLPAVETALDEINADQKAVKFLENGKLYIRRGEHIFDAQGVMVK